MDKETVISWTFAGSYSVSAEFYCRRQLDITES